ncbi:MAG: peptide-methionine (S)-S-oxide reductase MsrA [Hyphomicrobiaceae bacterium]|nr:peptide-methionine (S)-S-oxide reductase MsrA [Hyphomicrobiaceae bacterium]
MLSAALALAAVGAVRAGAAGPTASPAASGEATPVATAIATFATGCFWCTESDFDKVPGVLATTSGYIGGKTANPSYESVSTGRTGHIEALQVTYDPSKVTYQKLLTWFWRHVDPVDGGGQFCDRGDQYRPAIFVHSAEQRKLAETSRDELAKSGLLERPIAVAIIDATKFHPAEDYHQDYYLKSPLRYKIYRHGCGRDQRIEQIWSKAQG